ncbi:hypothetical protein APUTEX25_002546, partial [Auxenochlorella protothecoides]
RDDTLLFETPEELRCPITHDTFVNPVLTAGGHVYERSAIERHLAHRSTDPLTGAELPNKSLTPIYILQSRAMEYREASARACIEAASEPPPREPGAHRPIEYLRRGVELAAGTKLAIPGLPTETLEYVAAHPGNAYDELALVAFARGLFLSGLRDRAAHVYFSLLQEALCSKSDVPQAAALLAQCIGCWAGEPGKGVHVDADRHVIEKLSGLVATSGQGSGQQAALTWTQVVDLAGTAGLGDTFALSLCEHLLFRRGPGMAPPVGHQPSPAQEQWSLEKNLLLKYTSILCGAQVDELTLLEHIEKLGTAWRSEGEWLSQLDIVKQGDKLVVMDKGELGVCGAACKTLEAAADDILASHDTDIAEALYTAGTNRQAFTTKLCVAQSHACAAPPPPLPAGWSPYPAWERKAADVQDLDRVMGEMSDQGLRGKMSLSCSSTEMTGARSRRARAS